MDMDMGEVEDRAVQVEEGEEVALQVEEGEEVALQLEEVALQVEEGEEVALQLEEVALQVEEGEEATAVSTVQRKRRRKGMFRMSVQIELLIDYYSFHHSITFIVVILEKGL
jgi:pyruvate kinase